MTMFHVSANPSLPDSWTDYLAHKGAHAGTNRQCSIGYHDECSDPEGESCACHCHPHSDWSPKEHHSASSHRPPFGDGEWFATAKAVVDAAPANGQRVEPDYEAALEELRRARPEWTPYVGDPFVIRNIVDAAIGGKLLVDPPTETTP